MDILLVFGISVAFFLYKLLFRKHHFLFFGDSMINVQHITHIEMKENDKISIDLSTGISITFSYDNEKVRNKIFRKLQTKLV
jgi:hypothetical protein